MEIHLEWAYSIVFSVKHTKCRYGQSGCIFHRLRGFKFARTPVEKIQLAIVTSTQKWLSPHPQAPRSCQRTRERGGAWDLMSLDKHHPVYKGRRVAGRDDWAWASDIFKRFSLMLCQILQPSVVRLLVVLKELCLINWSWWTDSKSTVFDHLMLCQC